MSDIAGWAGHIEEAKLPYCGGHERENELLSWDVLN
jgi:hypothetical protein